MCRWRTKWETFALREPDPDMLLQFVDAMEFRTLGAPRARTLLPTKRARRSSRNTRLARPRRRSRDGVRARRWARGRSGGDRVQTRRLQDCVRDLPTLEAWIARALKRGRRRHRHRSRRVRRQPARSWSASRCRSAPMTRSTFRWRIAQSEVARRRIVRCRSAGGESWRQISAYRSRCGSLSRAEAAAGRPVRPEGRI